MMNKLLQRLLTPVFALLALGSAANVQAKPNVAAAHPALWEVSDADTKIYLFGTIHLLPDNYQWRTAKFDDALAGSQELIVETIVDQKNPAKLLSAMTALAFNTPNLPPVVDR